MRSPQDSKPRWMKALQGGVFLLAIASLLLALGAATALAAGGEEAEGGPPTVEPVIVPEVEVPSTPSVPVPVTTPSTPSSSPVAKPTESAPSSTATQTTHTSGGSTHSSGGSGGRSGPTSVTHTVRGPASSGSGQTGGSGSSGSSGSGESAPVSVAPTGSAAQTAVGAAPTSGLEKAAADLTKRAGGAQATDKKSRQEAVSRLGKALGTALLGKAAAVSHPEKKHAVLWVPLPGKSKLPYLIIILAIGAVLAFILMVQFTNPQRVRYWRARLFGQPTAAITVSAARKLPEPAARLAPDARPSRLRTAERASQRRRPRGAAPSRMRS